MFKRVHIYIIILTLGLLLLPSLTYACGTQSEKECCKKEMTSKSEHKQCSEESHSNNQSDSCNGKCGHSNCTSVNANYSSVVFNDFDLTHNIFVFSTKKQNFYTTITFISSGYSSLWLIPKIS
jgi:hypothetical protein